MAKITIISSKEALLCNRNSSLYIDGGNVEFLPINDDFSKLRRILYKNGNWMNPFIEEYNKLNGFIFKFSNRVYVIHCLQPYSGISPSDWIDALISTAHTLSGDMDKSLEIELLLHDKDFPEEGEERRKYFCNGATKVYEYGETDPIKLALFNHTAENRAYEFLCESKLIDDVFNYIEILNDDYYYKKLNEFLYSISDRPDFFGIAESIAEYEPAYFYSIKKIYDALLEEDIDKDSRFQNCLKILEITNRATDGK